MRELLRMLKAITGDGRYEEIIDSLLQRQEEKGESLLARLITCLLRDDRNNDIAAAVSDVGKRQSLYREYGLL